VNDINNHYRQNIKGIDSIHPVVDDKIMCINNNWDSYIVENNVEQYLTNGLIGNVTKVNKNREAIKASNINFKPVFFDTKEFNNILYDHLVFEGKIKKSSDLYDNNTPEEYKKILKKRLVYEQTTLERVNPFTYAYAITVHKSQGSEYNNVILFDEGFGSVMDKSKSLYTGITRAKENLIIVK